MAMVWSFNRQIAVGTTNDIARYYHWQSDLAPRNPESD